MTDAPKKTHEELAELLIGCPAPRTCWRHYKGGEYVITGSAVHESSQEPLVLYRPLKTVIVTFARPLKEWREQVEHEGRAVPRFSPC